MQRHSHPWRGQQRACQATERCLRLLFISCLLQWLAGRNQKEPRVLAFSGWRGARLPAPGRPFCGLRCVALPGRSSCVAQRAFQSAGSAEELLVEVESSSLGRAEVFEAVSKLGRLHRSVTRELGRSAAMEALMTAAEQGLREDHAAYELTPAEVASLMLSLSYLARSVPASKRVVVPLQDVGYEVFSVVQSHEITDWQLANILPASKLVVLPLQDVGHEVLRVVPRHEITDWDLANILKSASRLNAGNGKLAKEAARLLTERMQSGEELRLSAQHLANVMQSLGKLGRNGAELQDAAASVVKERLLDDPSNFKHYQALTIFQSAATMRPADFQLLGRLAALLLERLQGAPRDFRERELVEALWSTAKVPSELGGKWVSTLAAEIANRLADAPERFDGRSLGQIFWSMILWSAATLALEDIEDTELVGLLALAPGFDEFAAEFSQSTILGAAGTLTLKGNTLVFAAADVKGDRLKTFARFIQQALSNMIWATANIELLDVDSELVHRLAPAIFARFGERAASFKEQELSSIMLAAAACPLKMVDSKLVQTLASAIAARLAKAPERFQGEHLSNIFWASARLEMTDSELVHRLAPVISSRLAESSDNFDEQALSNLIWAAARLEMAGSQLVEDLAQVITARVIADPDGFPIERLTSLKVAVAVIELDLQDSELAKAFRSAVIRVTELKDEQNFFD